jgi:hypothetical protein
MGMRDGCKRLTERAPGLAHGERGFALPTVMFMLLAVFAIVSVGVFTTISAQQGAVRDQETKSGLTASEAGVTQALLTYNGGFTPLTVSGVTVPTCYTPVSNPPNTVEPRVPLNGGWCDPVSGSNASGSFTYQACPPGPAGPLTCAQPGTLEVVSTGNENGVTRRVDVVAKSVSGQPVFLDAGVKSQTNIVLDSNAEIHSPSSAGGSITLGSTSTKLCGLTTVGTSGTLTGSGLYSGNADCTGAPLSHTTVTHQSIVLPPINQGTAASVNDNCRISRAIPVADSKCTFNSTDPKDLVNNPGNITWTPSTRRLALTGQKTSLTLTGKIYSFCKLTMSQNSTLYVAPNQPVSIYFDRPEDCGPLPAYSGTSATAQMWLESNTRITASSNPSALNVALYFVGSPTIPTGVVMSSNSDSNAACVQNFVIYAPYTQIEMNSNSTYCGAIAAQSIHMDQNARFYTDDASRQIVLPNTAPHYMQSKFVDCTAAPASPPNAGC